MSSDSCNRESISEEFFSPTAETSDITLDGTINFENNEIRRRSSVLSLESLTLVDKDGTSSPEDNIELPSVFNAETIDFPSCPEELKLVYGNSMPVEAGVRVEGEDEDKSIYEAQLLSNCQDVRLIKDVELAASGRNKRKVIPVPDGILSKPDEDLKTESESFVDWSHVLSPVSTDNEVDDLQDSPDEIDDSIISCSNDVEPIPELGAAEEAYESRAWRSFSLAGVDRRIDLRVLEPYKRVVSHGGYLSQGSRNAIIVFSACYLPDRSRRDYDYVMDNLFMYVISTLDQLVTDDYVLVYLHGASQRSAMPKFSWLKQCYFMIDRKLRKNLKGLYLVHPTFLLKVLEVMTRPFISSKFRKKLIYIYSLSELLKRVPLERASIPEKVFKYDLLKKPVSKGYEIN